ncbi:MAG: AAA family ATPase [Magnetococcales bacterium]|nr:AAA family ATPase [Magnetococcales bacterium]
MFRKAERKQSKLRLALCGTAGSGKSYSAILIAKGLCSRDGDKIAIIDTENGSSELYSDLVDFDVAQLKPPYTPQRYIDLINGAEKAGYSTLIIDSLSHAWQRAGGILEMHDKATTGKTNSFAAWGVVTPLHNALVEAILNSPLHIIATMRTKTGYEIVSQNGRTKVNKLGLAPVQRENMEYEFTVVLDLISNSHTANASKDRTGLFANQKQQFQPNENTGKKLLQWLESGVDNKEYSSKQMEVFKKQLQKSNSIQSMKDWWHQNQSTIDQLLPEHIQEVKSFWISKKETLSDPINNHPSH